MAGFHIENFGCRAARADGEAIAAQLLRSGQHCMQQISEADVAIVNTCSVTAEADREARAYIRRVHRVNPEARIVVTGCYAQRAPEELAEIPGVAAVVGNSHKALAPEIAAMLASSSGAKAPVIDMRANAGAEAPAYPAHEGRRVAQACLPREEWAGGAVYLPHDFVALASLRSSSANGVPIFADDRFAHSFLEEARVVPGSQTRPNLKIQEGCGNRCTFCVIPQTRGNSRSMREEAVMKQVRGFVAAGGNELVFSGINLGRWGRDLGSEERAQVDPILSPSLTRERKDGAINGLRFEGSQVRTHGPGAPMHGGAQKRPALAGLVRRILAETSLSHLRLSSIEPMDWTEEMIALMAEFGGSRLCRHAHLPLQSGSDDVLRRMHRRYRPWHYAEKVGALVRAAGPELTIGTDVMVGFPGESDMEFEETLELIRALPFGYLHLFPFSPRPGTALHGAEPLSAEVMKERMGALRALGAEKMRAHREQFIGRELEAITLHTAAEAEQRGRTRALTENFLPIEVGSPLPANRLVRVQVTGMDAEMVLEGEISPVDRHAAGASRSQDSVPMALTDQP